MVIVYKKTNTSLEVFVGIWQRDFTPPHTSHTVSVAEPPHTLSLSHHLFLWTSNTPVLEKKKKQIKLSAREKMEHEVNPKHASCFYIAKARTTHNYNALPWESGLLSHMLSGFWNRHLVFKKDLKSKDLINQVSWFPYCSGIFQRIFVSNYRFTPKLSIIFWSVSKYQTIYCA